MNLADLLNAPTEIELDGVVYRLRQPTLMEQMTYQRWLEQRAREAAARAVDIPEEERRQLLRDITADIAVGTFEWAGPACVKALQTPGGLAKLIAIILADQKCTEAIARKLVDKQLGEIVAVLMRGDYEKKDLAPLLAKLGLGRPFLSKL
jgi:hypothetical protein